MHLVRGVSALLRRGSPRHSRGDESDGSGESSAAPSWPDIQFRNEGDDAFLGSLWQDYQEALGLEETQKTLEYFLVNFVRTFENWTPDEDSHRGEVPCQTAESEGSIYGDGNSTVVGCAHGHPTKVVFGLIRELKNVIKIFTALNVTRDGSPDAWLSESDISMSLLLTKALNIVTRAPHNQKIFSYFGGLQSLMGLMKAAVVQLKGVVSLVVLDGNTPDLVTSQLSFLQTLLSNIVSIVANYIDSEDKYGKSSSRVESRVGEPSDDPGKIRRTLHRRSSTDTVLETQISRAQGPETMGTRSIREATGVSGGTVPLMETGGLNWFVELLKLLRILRLKGVPSDSSLERLVLHSLQQTLMENTRSQNFFRVIGGLQVVLDGLETFPPQGDEFDARVRDMPRKEQNIGEPASPHEKTSTDKVSLEFDLQLLSLQVLREAIFRNPISLQSMREHGGVQKFAHLISWAAFTIPGVSPKKKLPTEVNVGKSVRTNLSPQGRLSASVPPQPIVLPSSQQKFQVTLSRDQDSTAPGGVQNSEGVHEFIYEGINLRSWNWRVADLCRILCSILVPVGDAMSFAAGIQGGPEGGNSSSVYWEQATRFIIDILIDIFQAHDGSLNEVNSGAFRLQSTTLQHYVLHVFKKMLEGTPTVVNLFRKDGVWELVFSEWFFYFGFGDAYRFSERGKTSGSKSGHTFNSTWKTQKTPSFDVNINAGNPSFEEFALSIFVPSDTEPLRLEVISFLELAATTSGISDNLLECGALMEALQQCSFLPRIVTMLAKSLHRILQLAPEPTIKSLRTLDGTSIITHVMEQQKKASMESLKKVSAGRDGKSGSEESSSANLWHEAMEALSTVFTSFLAASEDAVVEASRNSKAIDALFNLLWDTTTRAFAFGHIFQLMKLPPTCEQDQDAKLDLCLKYLQSLPRAQVESRSTDISIVFDLLRGMREVLQTDLTYYQALFRDGECFVHIVTLLNEERPAEVGSQLSLDVLLTLTRLLQGNEASKGSFRSIVGAGYKTLEFVLIDLHKGKPSRDLLLSLLDMLVDGSFQPSNMVIQNEDVVLLFFNILQHCNKHDQVNGLDTFQLLLEESTANRAACVRAGLLSLLLEWFAQEQDVSLIVKFGHLMKMIGGYSISGKDMRSIFALLRSSKDGLRPRHGTLLLQIFQGMLKEHGPAVFFDLSGRDSGIVVTSPLRWPSTRGFSFCAWARVENFPVSSSPKAPEGMMGLFSFLSESGKGCTATISSDQFVVETINTKRQITSLKVHLQTKRWYHICVTHNTQRALNGGNTIKVYIDGVLASSERLRYPKVGEVLTRCTIGASVSITTSDGIGFNKISGRHASAFCGQLGPIYLFDDAISSEQAKGVFSLGPDYMYSFLPSEVGYVPENISTDSIINEKDGLAFKMVFGYNAQASSGRALFDISPVLEYSPDPVLYDATIMTGTLLCYRHLVQDSVQCVGGIGVFFPLLTQLDQPVSTASAVVGSTYVQKHVEGYPIDSHVAVEVIDVLTAVLAGNLANQQYMRNMSGMSILGFLLQSVSPQHLTVNVVAALERLVTTVAKGSGASLATALVKEALVKLYFNPHIWIFTPLNVHRELYVSLIKYFKNDGSLLRSVCGLPRVLDMLRQFYWDKPKRKALGTKPLLHPVTKAVIGERPNRSGISELRQLVLVLAEGVLREKVTIIDVKALVAYLETSEDDVCVKDVLYMILGLLTQKSFVLSFIEHLNTLGGITILLNLIKRQQEVIRLLAFRLLGVLVVAMVDKKVAGSSFLGTSKATAEFQRVEKIKVNHVFSVMSECVAMFPFSDAVRATVFDILLGEACPKQLTQESSNTEQGNPVAARSLSRAKLTSQISNFFRVPEKPGERIGAFVLPQMLKILFKVLANSEDSMLRLEILKDTLGLLEANPLNSEALTLEPCWQGWLLAALAAALKRSKSTLGDIAEESVWLLGPEEALMRKLFRAFHVYCICTSRNGWLHVERTCNFVHLLAKEGQLSEFHTLHVLLGDLVEAIVEGLPLQASLFTQPCRDNALYLLSLVDELILGEAFDLLPSFAPGSANAEDNGLLSGEYVDLGLSPFKVTSSKSSEEDWESARPELARKGSIGVSRWRYRTSSGEHIDVHNKYQCWRLYDKVWSLLITMNGRGLGSGNIYQTGVAGPTLGQRARGLVESLNIPAAEMAAAVVSSGLGAVGMNPPNKLVDKVFRLRGERCPRIVFRLVVLYLYNADLQSASLCVQHFLALLPSFVSSEVEQNKNRLQLFLWTLLDARAKIGKMDDGARIHVISRLIQETIDIGKSMLAMSMVEKGKKPESSISESSVHSLLQRDRVVTAVIEEAKHLKFTTTQRAQDVEGLLSELDDANLAESQQKTALEDQSHVALSSICSVDRSRQSAAQLAYDEEQQAISDQWCHLFRYLTDERGPWSTVPFPNDVIRHWKLDKMEDPARRRLKLRRNYHFNKEYLHPVTSITKGPPVDLVNERGSSVELLMGEVRHFLLKGMRGVTEENLSDDEDNQLMSKGSEDSVAEVDAESRHTEEMSSAGDAIDESGASQEQVHVALPEEAGEEEVLLSVSCIMVSAKRKVAGRLEVMQSSLHFYGEFIVEGTGGRSVFTGSGGFNYPDAVSMEKGFNKQKMSGRKEFLEGSEADRGNSMERLDPIQGGFLKGIKRHSRWDLSQVRAVQSTRYLLQHTALEIFFTSSVPPVFFNFSTQRLSKDIGTMIVDLHNGRGSGKSGSRGKEHVIDYIDRRKASELAEDARKQWRRREMSNFDYLITLNTLAGRSYNDTTQYPVFPWILSDYTSDKLDLGNCASFRDLSKPVGALDEKRFEVFEERFQNFTDPDIPSFYYGSHYSSMGILLFYLLRLEPFTLLHRQLQGGKLDHADRLFHSIESAYNNCLTNSSDVKELIPEFFYLPEFLVNSNEYYLGIKQDGETLGDVVLPPWAKNSPELFIQLNREALESEYVSDHIHEWIDLVFGYKQRGRPAVEVSGIEMFRYILGSQNCAFMFDAENYEHAIRVQLFNDADIADSYTQAANVFYHLTYEGAVDLAAMEDCLERAAIEDQIANFGQTPIQLFRKKHPKRGPAQPIARPLYYAPASITLTSTIPPQSPSPGQKVAKVIFVGLIDGLVVTINKRLSVVVRTWITPALQNFTFSSSQDSYFGIGQEVVLSRKIYGPIVDDVSLSSCCFGTLLVRSSSFLLTCGHWDNSFKVISLDGGDMVQSNSQHKDVVTSLSVAVDGSVVVTGSRDTTVMVWDIEHTSISTRRLGSIKDSLTEKRRKSDTVVISDKPRHVLCGHDDAITSVAVRVELDIVVSGSKDATCIFHTLRTGRYVRSIRHPNRCHVTNLKVSQHGLVVVYSHGDLSLHVCSINGKWLASVDVKGRLNCMDISHCGHFLVCGGDQGQVLVFKLQTLEVVRRYEGGGVAVTSLTVTPEDCFLVGTQDGALLVFSLEFQYPKKAGFFASIQRHVR